MTPFDVFQSGVRAMERIVQAESSELLGALGVAADPYPHQIANVQRILEATEIRHLIADEVGLGKTVQSFMIINVLMRRDPSLRIAIVAPQRICYQWQAELSARGHVSGIIWDEADLTELPEGEGHVHIIKSDLIRPQPTLPSPQSYDMLIVDEPHVLSLQQVTFLSNLCRDGREGSRFRHVLLLTATPRLGNPEWARAILGIIEPDRTEIASRLDQEPLRYLADASAAAQERVSKGELDPEVARHVASANRRILRQTREAWPDVAPRRRSITCVARPNEAELPRINLANARLALEEVDITTRIEGSPWQQTRQLFWARETARNAIRHKTFDEFEDMRVDCSTIMARVPGEGLLEELSDVLVRIWESDPERRVIIVAGDTPTVDMLKQRLSRLFPDLADQSLIDTMRGRYNTDIVDVVGAVHGGARVLIMEEWVEAGLNLHHFADDLVFYNLPWSASRIDQLIGRLDRLRPGGFRKSLRGKAVGEITIWRLVIEGTPDQRVLEALDRIGVFANPMPFLDEDLLLRIERIVMGAAIGNLGHLQLADELAEELLSGIENIEETAPNEVQSAEASSQLQALQQSERLSEGWLRSIAESGAFNLGWPKTMDGERVGILSYPRLSENCPFSIGAMTVKEGEVFRFRRDRLGNPPKKDVLLDGDRVGRRARFFATGDHVHDDLAKQALKLALSADPSKGSRPLAVAYPSENPMSDFVGSTIAIGITAWQPAAKLPSAETLLRGRPDWEAAGVKGLRLLDEALLSGLDADLRWLRIRFPSAFTLSGSRVLDDGTEMSLPDELIREALSEKARSNQNRSLQATIPKCTNAVEVFREQELQTLKEQRLRIAELKRMALADFPLRRACIVEEASYYTRARFLNIERLEEQNIIDAMQRQMHEGQIAMERKRMMAKQQGAMIRIRILEDQIERLSSVSTPAALKFLIRVIPNAAQTH